MARRKSSTKDVIIEKVAEVASVSYATVFYVTTPNGKAQSEAHSHVQKITINPHHQLNLYIFSLVDNLFQIIKLKTLKRVVQYIGKAVQGFADILTAVLYYHFLFITNHCQTKEPTDTNMMICHMFGDLHLAAPVIWNLDTTKIFRLFISIIYPFISLQTARSLSVP